MSVSATDTETGGIGRLRDRLLAAGWPVTPNGRGLYVRCPRCNSQTVLVTAKADGRPTLTARCPHGCEHADTERALHAILDARRADARPTPRWELGEHALAPEAYRALRARAVEADAGNAERFAIDWADDVRYVISGGWAVWDGRRWRPDDDGAATRRAVETARRTRDEANILAEAPTDDPKAAEKAAGRRYAWGLASHNAPKVKACLEIARTDPRLIAHPDDLDADPFALCVGTGVIDLRTGNLRPHDRRELHTRLVPIAYDPDATCPRFEEFLSTVLRDDADLAAWLQRNVGYTISGDTREQTLTILHGEGANGKSTLLNTLTGMLGEHAITADSRTFTLAGADRAARSDLARLRGRRLVVASEIPRGSQLDEDLVKRITGGERITARFNRQDEFEYDPTFKVWLGVNHLPAIQGDDHAIWRRLRIVPFTCRIDRPDLELGRRLHAELPGILAWAVRGCLAWQAQGLGTCDAVEEATDAYRREQDQVARFIDECCTRSPRASVRNAVLYNAYQSWALARDLPLLSDKELGVALTQLGIATGKSHDHRVRKGISL